MLYSDTGKPALRLTTAKREQTKTKILALKWKIIIYNSMCEVYDWQRQGAILWSSLASASLNLVLSV